MSQTANLLRRAVYCAGLVVPLLIASNAQAQTKIVYGNVTEMTLSQVPMVAAKVLGYYKEEGLDVEMIGFKGTATLLPQMTAKRVDIGYPNPDILIVNRASGKDRLPLKLFYNMTRASGWEFVVPEDSLIKEIKDLDGKKLGIGALSFGNVPITKAAFKDLGINVEMVPVGVGAAAFLAFTNKQVDALNLFDAQHATLETQGTRIRRLRQADKYEALFNNGFIAHEDTIRDRPEVLVGFGRAIAKASVFCEANREACVRMFWKEYPSQKPTGDEATALANSVKIFSSRFDKMLRFPAGAPRQWGHFPAQGWNDFVDALYQGGQITTRDVDVQSCYTNDFVSKINDFDTAKIVAQAKAYKN